MGDEPASNPAPHAPHPPAHPAHAVPARKPSPDLTGRLKAFLCSRTWQDWTVLAGLVLIALTHASVSGTFKHLPGPIYGGDYYWHHGHAVHIRDGGSLLASSHYRGEYEHYPWLTHALIALASLVSRLPVLKVMLASIPLIALLGGLVVYLLGRKFLNPTVAIPMALFWAAYGDLPSATPTGVTLKLAIPLTVLAFASAQSLKGRMLAGLVFGLAGLQHVVLFVGSVLLIGVLVLFRAITGEGPFPRRLWKQVVFWLPVAAIGIPIALLFWWPPAFIYHNETPNNWQEYTGIGLQALSAGLTLSTLKAAFIPFSGIAMSLISILVLLGLYAVITKPKRFWLPIVVLLAGLAGFLHPVVTQPLFGFTIGFYRFPIWFVLGQVLFMGAGLAVLAGTFRDDRARLAILVGGILIAGLVLQGAMGQYANDRWMQYGKELDGGTQALFTMADWVRANTKVTDVFLAGHEESGFALNALTGRKLVVLRRTHASPFVDADRRVADAALILYGADNATREELLQKYGITYYYEDAYSVQSRQECLKNWDLLEQNGEASYSCLRTSVAQEAELQQAGIETKRVRARLDVASNRAPVFELLAIKPQERNKLTIQPLYGNEAAAIARIVP
jgi:hypothetical protein